MQNKITGINSQREEFLKVYQAIADSLNKKVSDVEYNLFITYLPPDAYGKAIDALKAQLCNRGAYPNVPSVVSILKALGIPIPDELKTPESTVTEISTKIQTAITRWGYTGGDGAVQRYLGRLGWEVVKRSGGWYNLCQTDNFHFEAVIKRLQETCKNLITEGFQDMPFEEEELKTFAETNLKKTYVPGSKLAAVRKELAEMMLF